MQVIDTLNIFLIAAVVSIAPVGHRTANVVNNLTGNSRLILEDVMMEMEKKSDEAFLHDTKAAMTITIRYAVPGEMEDGVLGQALPLPTLCTIEMSPQMNPDLGKYTDADFNLVLMHEIGHCFGLHHTPSTEDVMYYAYDYPTNRERSVAEFIQSLNHARGIWWK